MESPLYADLHVHTTISDGSDDFEEVLAQAATLGLTHVAFTNHDTVTGLSQAFDLQERFNVTVIGGIEISAWDAAENTKAHIIGLGFESERAPAIQALCGPLLERRFAKTRWQIEQLQSHGIKLDLDLLGRYALQSTCLYKQHVMAALTEAPHGSAEYQRLYRSLFKEGGICERHIPYVDARDAVRAIKEDGGWAVLAHPGQFNNFGLVARLARLGLDGIEKYHPDHGPKEWRKVEQLATEHNLFCTGGSDYHGAFGDSALGSHRIQVDTGTDKGTVHPSTDKGTVHPSTLVCGQRDGSSVHPGLAVLLDECGSRQGGRRANAGRADAGSVHPSSPI
ncbi:MAG: PHP domain-containing protein [Coriobacteriaceae bacterium]|jgi:predicted metal-dependent phosphoesterase TrpH|nr:PHP domain-containing protein [Coriobacteriaceae bacterium]